MSRRQRTLWVVAGIVVVCLAFAAVIAISRRDRVPVVSVGVTAAAYGADGAPASEATTGSPDLPVLLDMWGVGGGPAVPLLNVEPPDGIKAGAPLAVDIKCVDTLHQPLVGATVLLDWLLGEQRFHDVGYTNNTGRVSFLRSIPKEAKDQRCIVSVRVHEDDMSSFAYSVFIPQ